ncbi:MAG TPA: hypothetical protein P5277_02685 [Candidatus Paceibacterota bacterium]|nr:hypothetical protein [Candidatus Paceibacterota bacterium]
MSLIEETQQKLGELRGRYANEIEPLIEKGEYSDAYNILAGYFSFFDQQQTSKILIRDIHMGLGFLGYLESMCIELKEIDGTDEQDKEFQKEILKEGLLEFKAYLNQTALPKEIRHTS